jgi:hypothetical protein
MDTKDGREPAPPVTEPMRVSLIRDLALGTATHRQLADRYGRSVQAISQFSSRNADEINDVRLEMSEPMELWGVKKEEQIALIREQIDRARARIESAELTATQEKGWGNLLIKAIHQLSEITGQLPQRASVEVHGDGVKVVHEIGIDHARAFPRWLRHRSKMHVRIPPSLYRYPYLYLRLSLHRSRISSLRFGPRLWRRSPTVSCWSLMR